MAQRGRTGRLHPAVGKARLEMARVLNNLLGEGSVSASGKPSREKQNLPLVLAGVSGGPDSLALAALLAHFVRRGEILAGAVIVDHGLQADSEQVARKAAEQCRALGLAPVMVERAEVAFKNEGPEKAAQRARYTAFESALEKSGASAVLVGHTLNDQAETVLLGLARGSGTKSLAGMPEILVRETMTVVRPLLNIRRQEVEQICEAENLLAWQDPTNTDETMMRAKVRHTILPFLEENLGGDVATSLSRTAAIVGADAEYLEAQADISYRACIALPDQLKQLIMPENIKGNALIFDRQKLLELHKALRHRVFARAVKELGGFTPSFERLTALDSFAATVAQGGPVQLTGHVSAWKVRPRGKYRKQGLLILGSTKAKKAEPPHSPAEKA